MTVGFFISVTNHNRVWLLDSWFDRLTILSLSKDRAKNRPMNWATTTICRLPCMDLLDIRDLWMLFFHFFSSQRIFTHQVGEPGGHKGFLESPKSPSGLTPYQGTFESFATLSQQS
jgi:hypothetical protein